MKKVLTSAFLVFIIGAFSVTSAFAAVGEVIAAVSLMTTIAQNYYNDSVSSSTKQEQLESYKQLWRTESQANSNALSYLSYDSLCDACEELNFNGQPCSVVYNSSRNVYMIQAHGPFGRRSYSTSSGFGTSSIWNNTGYYFATTSGRIFCSLHNTDTLIDSIYDKLKTIESDVDQVEGRIARTVDGTTYTVADSTYHTWKTLEHIDGLLTTTQGGTEYKVSTLVYKCFDALDRMNNNLLTEQNGTTYKMPSLLYYANNHLSDIDTKIATTNSRLSSLLTAFNNLSVDLNLDDVNLSLSGDNVQISPNMAFCCGYKTDADGALFPTLTIPYDTAVDIIARLNTDYMAKNITVNYRTGGTVQRAVRSASLGSDGYIRVYLTNGSTYYLGDNVNTLFIVNVQNVGSNDIVLAIANLTSVVAEMNTSIEQTSQNVENLALTVSDIDVETNYYISTVQGLTEDDIEDLPSFISQAVRLVKSAFNTYGETPNWSAGFEYFSDWGYDN